MVVDLPQRRSVREAALAWLVSEGVEHLVLFQQVQIPDEGVGQRFQAWIDQLSTVSTQRRPRPRDH